MLVPLETLPGWPDAPNPTVLQFLGLLLAIPVIVGLIIGTASFLATTRDVRRFGPPVNPRTAYAGAPGVAGAAASAAIEAKPGADTDTGGTSARW